MNQRTLAVVTLTTNSQTAITTNTNYPAVDVGAGTGLGYANVNRREIKVLGGVTMQSGTTSVALKIQQNTTSGASGWTDVTGGAFTALTTEGALTPIHILVSQRYIRAASTIAGTTLSYTSMVYALLEQRES